MNPTDEFTKAVESALSQLSTYQYERGARLNGGFPRITEAEALASIQASTLEFFTALVGEDEWFDWPRGAKEDFYLYAKMDGRNELREKLRQKIDQLIKDLNGDKA